MTEEKNSDRFDAYGFSDAILKGINEAGFRVLSPIQKKAIPLIMEGRDLIGRAQTGTGKTAAFGLPAMDRIHREGGALLVITPTRELASQISEELYRLGRYAGIKTVAVYGGQPINRQAELINRGAQVVTATPGRLLDHLRSGRIKNFRPTMVVLDEGDEMLDMGFINDIEMIFHLLPEDRQTMLFSATIPGEIKSLAERILRDPVTVDVTPVNVTPEGIKQRYYVIQEREREAALMRLIDAEAPHKALVFCRTKKETDKLSTTLVSRGYAARSLHGDMSQAERNRAIDSFRKGNIDLLVATDVAARGLDIADVTHVFNYHIPFDPESYVHRIGRTGRAGKEGKAITLVTPLELKELQRIMKVSGEPMKYREIPSAIDVRKRLIKELMREVAEMPVIEDAWDMIDEMKEEMSIEDIAAKCLSILIKDKKVTGPKRLGLRGDEVKKMLYMLNQRKPKRSKRYSFGYKGRGGSRR